MPWPRWKPTLFAFCWNSGLPVLHIRHLYYNYYIYGIDFIVPSSCHVAFVLLSFDIWLWTLSHFVCLLAVLSPPLHERLSLAGLIHMLLVRITHLRQYRLQHQGKIMGTCWIFWKSSLKYLSQQNLTSCRWLCTSTMRRTQKKRFKSYSVPCHWIWWGHMISFWNLNPFKVNTSTVCGQGTVLQDAVFMSSREDFVRMLLDFGFVCV